MKVAFVERTDKFCSLVEPIGEKWFSNLRFSMCTFQYVYVSVRVRFSTCTFQYVYGSVSVWFSKFMVQ